MDQSGARNFSKWGSIPNGSVREKHQPPTLVPPSAAMVAKMTTKRSSSNRKHQPQTPDQQTAHPDLPRSEPDASKGHVPPTPPESTPVSTTTGKTKWTASELWSLTNAVHDKQPYIAKHTEKAARWDDVRDIVNEGVHHERTSKSYQLQMKRLLSWQQGSKVLRLLYYLDVTLTS